MNQTGIQTHHENAPAPQPVARYIVEYDGEFHWLLRRSATKTLPISPYTNRDIAQDSAAHLNTHVRWEAP